MSAAQGLFGGASHEGCSCGHRLEMFHRVNASRWCGVETPNEVLRAALIRCAELSGADMTDGVPDWPSLEVWAVRCVEQLRADYDEVLKDAPVALSPETSE